MFNLLAVSIMYEKIHPNSWGNVGPPFRVPRRAVAPTTHLRNENIQSKMPEIILITLAKSLLRISKSEVIINKKEFIKGCMAPINPSPRVVILLVKSASVVGKGFNSTWQKQGRNSIKEKQWQLSKLLWFPYSRQFGEYHHF